MDAAGLGVEQGLYGIVPEADVAEYGSGLDGAAVGPGEAAAGAVGVLEDFAAFFHFGHARAPVHEVEAGAAAGFVGREAGGAGGQELFVELGVGDVAPGEGLAA
jgi:hypothetical protein